MTVAGDAPWHRLRRIGREIEKCRRNGVCMRDVFISYHTESAKSVVETIARQLEERGVSCWYAPRDCERTWVDAIVQAIDTASVFLVVLNSQSCNSEHVKNEIHVACNNAYEHKIRIVPFQIEEKCTSNFVRYYLGRTHILDGTTPPLDDRIQELINRISYIVKDSKHEHSDHSQSVFVSSVITSNANFVGRMQEISALKPLLDQYKKVFVSGMGGIGKSELVKQFACQYQKDYAYIMYGSMKSTLKDLFVEDDFIKIPGFARTPSDESDDSYFRRKLDYIACNSNFETLLIIDNFDSMEDPDLETIMGLPVSIAFTTRAFQYDSMYCFYPLKSMQNTEDLLQLFKKGYPQLSGEEDCAIAVQMMEMLGRHTLAIKLLSSHMRRHRIKPAKMLDVIQKNEILHSDDMSGVTSIFAMSDLTQEEKKILINLALVPMDGISAEEFSDALQLEDYEAIDNLISKSWIQYDSTRDYVSLHPIVTQLAFEKIGYSDELCENYIHYLSDLAQRAKYIEERKRNVTLKRVERLNGILTKESKHYVPFVLASGQLFHAFSKHHKTVEFLRPLAEGDFDQYAKVEALTDIADAYRCTNDVENLKVKADEAWQICQMFSADDARGCKLKAELQGRYGWYYYFREEYETALLWFNRQRELVQKWEQDNPERIGWAYFNVAMVQSGMGQWDNAINMYKNALAYFRQIKMDFAVAVVMRHVGEMYLCTEDYALAKEYLEEAMGLYQAVVGEKHNDMAVLLHDFAKLYVKTGNEELAREQERRVREYCEESGYTELITDWLFA